MPGRMGWAGEGEEADTGTRVPHGTLLETQAKRKKAALLILTLFKVFIFYTNFCINFDF